MDQNSIFRLDPNRKRYIYMCTINNIYIYIYISLSLSLSRSLSLSLAITGLARYLALGYSKP